MEKGKKSRGRPPRPDGARERELILTDHELQLVRAYLKGIREKNTPETPANNSDLKKPRK